MLRAENILMSETDIISGPWIRYNQINKVCVCVCIEER